MATPSVAHAESIALLHLLHSVPAPPSRNPVDAVRHSEGRYTLSFESECSLASTLAFLSSTTGDSDYIPAVCLEEDARSAVLNVWVAVNKADYNDGNQALKKIKQGLEQIFALLSQLQDGKLPPTLLYNC
jgi:hypothetical protein